MAQPKFKITIVRENQPAHQMSEQSGTVTGDMLKNMLRAFIDMREDEGLWFMEKGMAQTWKSVTITRLDGEHEA